MAASYPFLKKLNESEHQQHHETGAKNNKNMMLIFWLYGQHPYLGKDTIEWKQWDRNDDNNNKQQKQKNNILKPPGTLAQKTKQQ